MATKNITEQIAAELRAEMARQKITQTDLADKLFISQRALGYRLNGERKMSWGDTAKVAAALGLKLSEVVIRAETALASLDQAPAAA